MNNQDVNIYFVPNNKNKTGGKFYNVYLNREERLDLKPFLDNTTYIDELEEKIGDATFKKAGGIILRRNDSIVSATVYTQSSGNIELNHEQQDAYQRWLQLDKISDEIYKTRKKEMEEFTRRQHDLDSTLLNIQVEKEKLSKVLYKKK